jgi:hypothetical protein
MGDILRDIRDHEEFFHGIMIIKEDNMDII